MNFITAFCFQKLVEMVTGIGVLHELSQDSDLKAIFLIRLNILDQTIISLEAKGPVCVGRTKVEYSFAQMTMQMHVRRDFFSSIEGLATSGKSEQELVGLVYLGNCD